MKIAMFTDTYYPRINGVTISVQSYAAELIKLGHEVCIVTNEYPEDSNGINTILDESNGFTEFGAKIVRVPSMKLIFSKEDRLGRLEKWFFVKKTMDEWQPDVIHVNTEWAVGYLGAMYARHRRKPFTYTFHTLWEDYIEGYAPFLSSKMSKKMGKELVKFYLKYATVIIAPTKRIAYVVERYGIEKTPYLLPTGIPSSLFVLDPEKQKTKEKLLYSHFPQLVGKNILLYVGRVANEKNLDFLLDVNEKIQQKRTDTVMLIVGDGPYMKDLQKHITERKMGSTVFCSGYLDRRDLPYIYSLATVFTFPSKTETQGLVTAEAMLAGLPVVAIGEMGTVDVMQGDNGGYMVPDDASVFSDKVLQLLDSDELRLQKSKEAKEWGKRWTIENMTQSLVEIYKDTIRLRNQN